MSKFSYQEYQDVIARAKASTTTTTTTSQKVGFFKLKDNGDSALVRFCIESVDDLQFATVHQLGAANKWMKVNCLAPLGSSNTTACPLCGAAAQGNTIGKAAKRVFVKMLVSYYDTTTGSYSAAIPVVWERPAGFSKEIAGYIRDYGNLKERVLKITRNGEAGDRGTTYSVSYIPTFDNPNLVSTDFSAFDGFDLTRHSYWVKSKEEIEEFLATGAFPEVASKATKQKTVKETVQQAGLAQQPVADIVVENDAKVATPTVAQQEQAVTAQPIQQQATQPVAAEERPQREISRSGRFTF